MGNIRKFLRQIWVNVQSNHEPEQKGIIAQSFSNRLVEVYSNMEAEWRLVEKQLRGKEKDHRQTGTTIRGTINCIIPPDGFGQNTVYRLLLSHSRRSDYLRNLPMAAFVKFNQD